MTDDPIDCTCATPTPADASLVSIGNGGPLQGECLRCRRAILGREASCA